MGNQDSHMYAYKARSKGSLISSENLPSWHVVNIESIFVAMTIEINFMSCLVLARRLQQFGVIRSQMKTNLSRDTVINYDCKVGSIY
jgi:hypothetical protein